MPQALIIFTSLTGNTEQCTDILAEALESHGIDVEIHDVMQADPQDFLDFDITIIGTYTYGVDGVLPDEMLDFYDELNELDLTGKIFGVFGSGDTFYEGYFCKAVDTFEQAFTQIGATKGGESVKVNLNPEDEDIEALEQLAASIAEHFNN
ncbi:flavodoxin [Aerococcaceae bacterium NML191292]|nr:flavodoxin [Aerococcaceae bacterium NML191292]MCW6663383.1 flavodoxin [Aerococcaceae bacterium NML190073]MCW6664699.1 flavodoxin [Aerococcaceae bacterium NML191219]MCW6666683.1 flavodoxin [Aerococcaceae bacterium NML190938]MCW6676406.1 flavodoxin [Aerococcaceae bacterium NML180378]